MQTATKRKAKQKTVLVVDDNAIVRGHVRELFLSDGFAVCAEAENGLKALEIASECHPDIIILDLVMPVMNGIQAAPKLRELLPNTPIILFSLHASYLQHQEIRTLGISATFMKGDPLQELLQKALDLTGESPR